MAIVESLVAAFRRFLKTSSQEDDPLPVVDWDLLPYSFQDVDWFVDSEPMVENPSSLVTRKRLHSQPFRG